MDVVVDGDETGNFLGVADLEIGGGGHGGCQGEDKGCESEVFHLEWFSWCFGLSEVELRELVGVWDGEVVIMLTWGEMCLILILVP